MGIPFSLLYFFPPIFRQDCLSPAIPDGIHFQMKLGYNIFYGSELIKWLQISNDIQKVLEGRVIFPKKFFFSFKRSFRVFWSVAFIFPKTLLLQMNGSTPRIGKGILSIAQLRGLDDSLPGLSRRNRGVSISAALPVGREKPGNYREGKPGQGTSPVATATSSYHTDELVAPKGERFRREIDVQTLTPLSSEKWLEQELAISSYSNC